jgi:hypothetical protein
LWVSISILSFTPKTQRRLEVELFVGVVESGSFSAAGRDLKLGRPAVSKMVAGLEVSRAPG